MRGIKECVMWMIDNPRKRLTNDIGETVYFNEEGFHTDGKMPINIYNFKPLNCYNWEPVPELVDFTEAINSGKEIYPMEYLSPKDKPFLFESYTNGDPFVLTALTTWLAESIEEKNIAKYMNMKWIIKE